MSSATWINEQIPPEPKVDWLSTLHREGLNQLTDFGWPNRKTEAWKYSPLTRVLKGSLLETPNTGSELSSFNAANLPAVDGIRLVFVNGQFESGLSDLEQLPAGVCWVRYSEANQEQQAYIQAQLQSGVVAQHSLTALHQTRVVDGWLLDVDEKVRIEKPIYWVHWAEASEESYSVLSRCVRLGKQSEMTLIEHQLSSEQSAALFQHQSVHFDLADSARLRHQLLQLDGGDQVSVGSWNSRLANHAYLETFIMGLGGHLKRVDYSVCHQGEGAESRLDAAILPKDKQHFDLHTQFEHEVPHTQSQQVVRTIADDQAKAVFNGRIHIHPQAQKTLAELSNKNLLLSEQAEVYTKPELEIYADDVRCAHGATVSQLDHQALNYLRSRGISKAEAEVMLSFGFIQTLIQRVDHDVLIHYLVERLTSWFGADQQLTQHLGSL